MLQNAYLLAKIGADTAENERNFAEILPKIGNYPTGPLRGPGKAADDLLAAPEVRRTSRKTREARPANARTRRGRAVLSVG